MTHNVEFIAFAIRAGLALFLLIFAWQCVYLPTAIDVFRQRMFWLRRKLFLLVVSEQIRPNHPAYTLLRYRLNGLIRFGEHIQFSRMLLIASFNSPRRDELAKDAAEKMESVHDPLVHKVLCDIDKEMGRQIILHLARTSPVFWVAFIIYILPISVARAIRTVREDGTCAPVARSPMEDRIVRSVEAEAQDFSEYPRSGRRDLVGV